MKRTLILFTILVFPFICSAQLKREPANYGTYKSLTCYQLSINGNLPEKRDKQSIITISPLPDKRNGSFVDRNRSSIEITSPLTNISAEVYNVESYRSDYGITCIYQFELVISGRKVLFDLCESRAYNNDIPIYFEIRPSEAIYNPPLPRLKELEHFYEFYAIIKIK